MSDPMNDPMSAGAGEGKTTDEQASLEAKLGDVSLGEEGKASETPSATPAAAASATPAPPVEGDWSSGGYNEENIPDITINGKTYKALADGKYDAIIMSTGLKECVLAGLLAVRGLKVLQVDRNPYYGGACASLTMEELYKHFDKPYDEEKVRLTHYTYIHTYIHT
jgi:hypothetical protein